MGVLLVWSILARGGRDSNLCDFDDVKAAAAQMQHMAAAGSAPEKEKNEPRGRGAAVGPLSCAPQFSTAGAAGVLALTAMPAPGHCPARKLQVLALLADSGHPSTLSNPLLSRRHIIILVQACPPIGRVRPVEQALYPKIYGQFRPKRKWCANYPCQATLQRHTLGSLGDKT
jgi:hypothetical protein